MEEFILVCLFVLISTLTTCATVQPGWSEQAIVACKDHGGLIDFRIVSFISKTSIDAHCKDKSNITQPAKEKTP